MLWSLYGALKDKYGIDPRHLKQEKMRVPAETATPASAPAVATKPAPVAPVTVYKKGAQDVPGRDKNKKEEDESSSSATKPALAAPAALVG